MPGIDIDMWLIGRSRTHSFRPAPAPASVSGAASCHRVGAEKCAIAHAPARRLNLASYEICLN